MSRSSVGPGHAAGDYAVGYGQPPAEHQFTPGTSGNPGGRPRKLPRPEISEHPVTAHTLTHRMILEEAHRPVKVRQGSKVIEISATKAAFLGLQKNALAGSRLAQRDYLALVERNEATSLATRTQEYVDLIKIQQELTAEVESRKIQNLPIDDIFPHPEDIIINPRTGAAAICGPINKQERDACRNIANLCCTFQHRVTELAAKHGAARNSRSRAATLHKWHSFQAAYDRANDILPNSMARPLEHRSYAPGASRPGESLVKQRPKPKSRRTKVA